MKHGRRAAVAALVAGTALAGGSTVVARTASAAQSTQQVTCGDTVYTVRTNNNNSSQNGGWGAAQIVSPGSGHGIPTSFTFSAVDETANLTLFSGSTLKGNGNANQNQQTITCNQSQTGTLADFIAQNGPPPGGQLPPGTSLTDTVITTFIVTVVVKSS